MKATLSNERAQRVEWIIVNDDRKINAAILMEAMPAKFGQLRGLFRMVLIEEFR